MNKIPPTFFVLSALILGPILAAAESVPIIELKENWGRPVLGRPGRRRGRSLPSGRRFSRRAPGHDPDDRSVRPREKRRLQGYLLGRQLRQDSGRAVRRPLVVSDGIRRPGRPRPRPRRPRIRRDQLPGRHLAEREKDRRHISNLRRVPPVPARRHRRDPSRSPKRPGRHDPSGRAGRFDHGIRRLEPESARFQHGDLAPGPPPPDRRPGCSFSVRPNASRS